MLKASRNVEGSDSGRVATPTPQPTDSYVLSALSALTDNAAGEVASIV